MREVAGAGVYTDRRAKSEEELANTDSLIAQIEGSVKDVKKRLDQLFGEKEALENFWMMDKQKRAIEFAVIEADMRENTEKQRETEQSVDSATAESADKVTELQKVRDEVSGNLRRAENLKAKKEAMEGEAISLQHSCDLLVAQREKMTLRKADLEDELGGDQMEESLQEQREELAEEVREVSDALTAVSAAVEVEDEQLALMTHERDQVYTRMGRGQQFTCREARDEWIHQQLLQIQTQLQEKNLQLEDLSQFTEATKRRLEETTAVKDKQAAEKDELEARQGQAHRSITELLNTKADLSRSHGDNCAKINRLKNVLSVEEEVNRSLYSRMNSTGGLKPILQGEQSIGLVLQSVPEL